MVGYGDVAVKNLKCIDVGGQASHTLSKATSMLYLSYYSFLAIYSCILALLIS